jgi:hypothetical protein
MGGFDLEHHLWYPAEVHIGDTVAIRVRFLARSPKLIHYLLFMENETRGMLSSVFECVYAHADLKIRRTAPFPVQIAARIDAFIAEHRALSWTAPSQKPALRCPDFAKPGVGLTRIIHEASTAAADPGMSTALRSVGFLDVLSSTPAESSHRAGWNAPDAPCIHARLRRLATKPREKCGLGGAFWISCAVAFQLLHTPLHTEGGSSP